MTERDQINQETGQRVALFEAINRELKRKYPDPFFNPLFPFSQGSYVWVKDMSGLYGDLETHYQLIELSHTDLQTFLKNGVLTKKSRNERRHNPKFQEWVSSHPREWNAYLQKPTAHPYGIPPEMVDETISWPIAQIDLEILSAELKLGFVDHARGVETERIRREQEWRRAEFEALVGQIDRAETQPQEQEVEPPEKAKGNPVPERYPGQVELKFPPSNTVEVYDTRDRSTRTFRTPWDKEGYRLKVYLVGGNYVIEWKDGNFHQHTEVFPADHCRLNIKPR